MGQLRGQARGRNFKVCQLCNDICLVMINFIWKWIREDNFRRVGFILQNSTQEQALLGSGEVRRWVYIARLPPLSSVESKTFMTSLLWAEAPCCCCCFVGGEKWIWNFICLSKCYDVQEGQTFQDMFNSLSSLAFNTVFIIKHAPEFIFLCQAIGQ